MKKGIASRGFRFFKEGVNRGIAHLARKVLRSKSFPLLGTPSGIDVTVRLKKELYPSIPITLRPPMTIEDRHYWVFQIMLGGVQLPEDSIMVVPDGMATHKGGNLSADGKLIPTFLRSIDQGNHFKVSSKHILPKIYTSQQPIIALTADWQSAFYHWIFEILPRLHLAEKGGFPLQHIYVETSLPFQKQTLEFLGVTNDQIIPSQVYGGVKTPQLVVPSVPLVPSHWVCQFLRDKIVPKLSKTNSLRLYVSRSDASRRRILNEEQVERLLVNRYGFQKVELSRLSFKEQAEYFLSAEAVVGPHGAGLSHLVFCNPKTPVLEIFSPTYVNICYWHICDRVGLPYYYLFGEGERPLDFVALNIDADITVDLPKLEAALKLMKL
jgi:hypothetical protein